MALDDVLLELAGEKKTMNTIRFLRFSPDAVLLGHHQSADEEIRMDHCRRHRIDINRRITGGGAIYFDRRDLGWEIVCDKQFFRAGFFTEKLFKRLCDPVVTALRRLGANAGFRPRNDIECNGRKISGTGGTELYGAFLFQGTILVDTDIEMMQNSLNVPVDKLDAKEVGSIGERVTTLTGELGRTPELDRIKTELRKSFEDGFHIRLVPGPLTEEEERRFREKLPAFQSVDWIYLKGVDGPGAQTVSAARRCKAGTVRFTIVVRGKRRRVGDILINGDFLSFPSRGIYDLMAELKGRPLDREHVLKTIRRYFDDGLIRIPGMTYDEFIQPLEKTFEEIVRNAPGRTDGS